MIEFFPLSETLYRLQYFYRKPRKAMYVMVKSLKFCIYSLSGSVRAVVLQNRGVVLTIPLFTNSLLFGVRRVYI
jgi:hypothetical protein